MRPCGAEQTIDTSFKGESILGKGRQKWFLLLSIEVAGARVVLFLEHDIFYHGSTFALHSFPIIYLIHLFF